MMVEGCFSDGNSVIRDVLQGLFLGLLLVYDVSDMDMKMQVLVTMSAVVLEEFSYGERSNRLNIGKWD